MRFIALSYCLPCPCPHLFLCATLNAAFMDEALLVQEYRARILYFVLSRVRDRSAAEEITQDVLLIVIQALRENQVRESSKLGSYIFGVARNLILRHRNQSHKNSAWSDGDPEAISWSRHPEAEFFLKEQRARVRQALDRLGSQDREILYLAFVEGDDLKEIARKLGIPYAAARKRKSRAVERLRKIVTRLSQKGQL